MTATTPASGYRSTVAETAKDGFGRLLLAEWTKLRSVPRWMLTLAAAAVLTILVALLTASGSRTSGGGGGEPPSRLLPLTDQGHYTYRTLAGDGGIVARVASQSGGSAWAKAGLMIRGSAGRGTPYAALMVTPGHGVRLQTGYHGTGAGGGTATAPRWLRLTRAGATVTGYESADGRSWNRVGAVTLKDLGRTALVGLFVASPDDIKVERRFGGESAAGHPEQTTASFDHVAVTAASGTQPDAAWRDRAGPGGPNGEPTGGSTRTAAGFTLEGTGDIGPDEFGFDTTRTTLTGVLIGQAAIVALAVLFVTAEYRRGMIRTTFLASPRRGRVLAAKAAVAGLASFAAGLAAGFGALLTAFPVLRSHGLAPPPLTAWPVLRAALGTALLLAVIAVFATAVAVLLRRSAPAIALVLLLLLVPQIVSTGLPVSAARWLDRCTPAAGFAVQQTIHRYDTAIGPWAGLGVLCAYTAAALAAAAWLLRRRDA